MSQTIAERKPLFSAEALKGLIIPLLIEQLLAMSVGAADTIMLSGVGEAAVSGVSLVDTINNLIIKILAALATGGTVVCAQYIGRKDPENARMAAKQVLYVAVALALLVMLPMLLVRRPLIGLIFGTIEPAVMENADVYLLLTALSFPFLAVYNACAAVFRAMGNSRVSLNASAIMNGVNIAGNAILIYGFGWGAMGAGVATLASRMIAAVIMMRLIQNPDNTIWLSDVLKLRFDGGMIKSILRIGVPGAIENGMFNFGKLIVQSQVALLGTSALAANAIMFTIGNFGLVPGLAMGMAMVTVVGQCVGANDYAQAKRYVGKLMLMGYVAMGVSNLPLIPLCGWITGLFRLSAEAAGMVQQTLPLFALLHFAIWPLAFLLPNALRAAGDAGFTMTISMLSMWTMRVGLCYVFVGRLGLGLQGVWYAMYADWVVRIACFTIRYFSGKWMTKRVIS